MTILCNQAKSPFAAERTYMTKAGFYLLSLSSPRFTLLNVTLFALLRSRITGDASTLARLSSDGRPV